MNIQELATWERLSNLGFDVADAALPFSARLARDNGWPASFAERAVEEYRRFCFLAVHAGHPVTPSDEVDQVWHLHLLYSRHYWETLCRDTLEMPLHHGPTQGGAAEGHKYHAWYEDTLASYRRYFGEPPKALWPAPDKRFDAHDDFVRMNSHDVVTLDRAWLRRGWIAAVLVGAIAMAHAVAQVSESAAPRTGAELWPILFILLLVVAAIAVAAGGKGVRRKQHKGKRAAAASCGATSGAGSKGNGDNGDNGAPDGGGQGCGGAAGSGGASACGGGGGGCGSS
jgi:hypothetical protein